ncbi:MAG: class I SAM-dependent RNA methyltransferase [Anaerolineales bacterium]|nr:class I SAM-dependent RNA methyltransferase [Anaerolineales bacterium]
MTARVPDLLTAKLDKLAYGGEALGRLPDGRVVFVPLALPGETVRLRILEEKRGHVRAALVEVLEAAPERILPKCRHFGVCGGCHYQHMAYPDQLRVKTGILIDQLRRIGKIDKPPVRPIVESSKEWNYRNHVQFHLSDNGNVGFIGMDGQIVPIQECHLPEQLLNDLWPILAFEPELELERIGLRLDSNGEALLILESEEAPEMEIETDLSVVHLRGEDTVVVAGEEAQRMLVNGRPFRLSAAAFFQINTPMAEKMVTHLLEILPVNEKTTLLDIYCGVGLFSAFFAPRTGRVIGIELSPSACEDFAVNLDEFENVELYQAPAEDVLPHLEVRAGVALVDPPRSGLERRVLEALLSMRPEWIAYVSCDPSTLARDARRLIEGGYRLVEVTPFDLFPQTYHIESISLFKVK